MTMLTQAMGMTVRSSPCRNQQAGSFFIPLLLILPRLFGERGLIFCQASAILSALLFPFSDPKYLSHSIALVRKKSLIRHPQVKVEAFHFRMGNGAKPPVFYRFLVEPFGCSDTPDSVPIIST